jgi:hypothetical protein
MERLHALLACSPPAPQQCLREQTSLSHVPCRGPCPLLRLAASVRGHRCGHYGMGWEGGSTPCPYLSCLGAPARGHPRPPERLKGPAAHADSRAAEEGQRGRVAAQRPCPTVAPCRVACERARSDGHTQRPVRTPIATRACPWRGGRAHGPSERNGRRPATDNAGERHANVLRTVRSTYGSGHAGETHLWASVCAPLCARVRDQHGGATHVREGPLLWCPWTQVAHDRRGENAHGPRARGAPWHPQAP